MPYISNVQDTDEHSKYYIGFPKGLNTIQDPVLVDDKNVTEATNAILEVDGLRRRHGSTKSFDQATNTSVLGAFPFYKKSTAETFFLRIGDNGYLQKLVSSVWENVSTSTTWNTSAQVHFVQARNKVFIYNGVNNLRHFDGTTITTYTSVSTPTNLTVTPTGTPGTTSFSYRVEAFNSTGRTIACASATTTTGNATLTASNYNKLDWDAMAGADGYNVFGRTAGGIGECYIDTVYTNTYNDMGAETPSTSLLPSDGNTTGGVVAKKAILATFGRQVAIGVTEGTTYYPTRLYYSGVLEYIDAFVGGDYGGGWVEIGSNDGGELIDIAPYKNGILVVKTNGVYKFYFTAAGIPAVEEITTANGGVSYRCGKVIDNDYVFVGKKDNRLVVTTVGQQQNYVSDQLRTNDISVFISDGLNNAEFSQIDNICTFLYDYKFGFAYTTSGNTKNNAAYILDTRFGGWVYWDGLPTEVSSYVVYDSGSSTDLYGCSHSDGYMIKLFQSDRNDNGSGFTTRISTKSYNQNMFNVKKVYRNPSLWFKYMGGGLMDVYVYSDTSNLLGSVKISLSPSNSGTMVGIDLPGAVLSGGSSLEMSGSGESYDYPQEITMLTMARSLKFSIVDTNIDTDWLFMGVNILYTPLDGMPLEQQYKVYLS